MDSGSSADRVLPLGMRDLLPDEARRSARLRSAVLRSFEIHGYGRVELPAFEYADVIGRGLGERNSSAMLRFVEADSGKPVALRPDMTPQVARLFATRLQDWPLPARLYYHGSVLRRPAQRARRRRQTPQAGIELLGAGGLAGDAEVLEVAASTVSATGLGDWTLDLAHAAITPSLLTNVPQGLARRILDALSHRDTGELSKLARRAALPKPHVAALDGLAELHGDLDVWREAEPLLADTPAAAAARELQVLHRLAVDRRLAPRISVDLGELWNFEYYTGTMFQMYAEGPGQAFASGGRYDSLLGKYGSPRDAAGFAVDLDLLGWALDDQSGGGYAATRLVVRGGNGETLRLLRREGIACCGCTADATHYAQRWGFSHVLDVRAGAAELIRMLDGVHTEIACESPTAMVAAVARHLEG